MAFRVLSGMNCFITIILVMVAGWFLRSCWTHSKKKEAPPTAQHATPASPAATPARLSGGTGTVSTPKPSPAPTPPAPLSLDEEILSREKELVRLFTEVTEGLRTLKAGLNNGAATPGQEIRGRLLTIGNAAAKAATEIRTSDPTPALKDKLQNLKSSVTSNARISAAVKTRAEHLLAEQEARLLKLQNEQKQVAQNLTRLDEACTNWLGTYDSLRQIQGEREAAKYLRQELAGYR